jgi:hypothetical protein
MDNYGEKFMHIYKRQDGICPACNDALIRKNDPITMQHRFPKPRKGREHKRIMKLLYLFIDCTLNLYLVHLSCNTTKHRSYGRITEYNAIRYQKFLEKHKKISEFVNNP